MVNTIGFPITPVKYSTPITAINRIQSTITWNAERVVDTT